MQKRDIIIDPHIDPPRIDLQKRAAVGTVYVITE